MAKKTQNNPFSFTLGDGPFRYVGMIMIKVGGFGTQLIGNVPADTVTSGIGTCAHCGAAIMNCYIVETGNGQRFGVGSTCIGKVSLPSQVVSEMEKAKRAFDSEKRREKAEIKRQAQHEQNKRDEAEILPVIAAFVEKHSAVFTAIPHKNDFLASQGKTMVDYVNFMTDPKQGFGITSYRWLLRDLKALVEEA